MPNTTRALLALAALMPLAWGFSSGTLWPRQETQDMPRPRFGPVPWGEQLGRDDFPCVKAGQIAFTFEDGPSPYTPEILGTLLRYNLRATFFMTGDFEGGGLAQPLYHELARFMYDRGHLLGSHSYRHDDLRRFTAEQVRADLLEMEAAFVEVLGVVPTYFRAPFTRCDFDGGDCLDSIRPLAYHVVDFNIDSFDNDEFADPADLVALFRETLDNSDRAVASYIVRLHDNEEATANGLFEDFIAIALDAGFELVTVGECLGDEPGNFYRNPQTGNALGDGSEPLPSPDPSASTESTVASASTSVSSSTVDATSSAAEATGAPETTGNPDTVISDAQTSTATDQEAAVTLDTLTQETLSVASTTIETAGSEDLTITETQTSTQTGADATDDPTATITPAVTGTSDVVMTSGSTPTMTQISVSSAVALTSSEQTTDVSQTTPESSLDATGSVTTTELVSQTTSATTSEEPSASQSSATTRATSETTDTGSSTPASSAAGGQGTSEASSDPGSTTIIGTNSISEVTETGSGTYTATVTGIQVTSDILGDPGTPTTSCTTSTTSCTTSTCTTTAIASTDGTATSVSSTDGRSQSSPVTTSPLDTITGGSETLDSTTQDAQTNSQYTPSSPSPTSASEMTPLSLSSSVATLDSTAGYVQTNTLEMTAPSASEFATAPSKSPSSIDGIVDSTIRESTPSVTAAPASDVTFSHPSPSVDETQTIKDQATDSNLPPSATAHLPNHIHYASDTIITHTAGATYCPSSIAQHNNGAPSPPVPTGGPQDGSAAVQEPNAHCSTCQDGAASDDSSLGSWLTMASSRAIGEQVDSQSVATSTGAVSAGGTWTYTASLSPLGTAQPSAASAAGDGAGGLPSGAETGGVGGPSAVPTRVLDAGGFAVRGSGCAVVIAVFAACMLF